MSDGHCRPHEGLYVFMVGRDNEKYLKKVSGTSTLVVNKITLQIFNPMVV